MATQFVTATREEWEAWADQQGGLTRRLFLNLIGDQQGDITLKKLTTKHTEGWKLPTDRELRRIESQGGTN